MQWAIFLLNSRWFNLNHGRYYWGTKLFHFSACYMEVETFNKRCKSGKPLLIHIALKEIIIDILPISKNRWITLQVSAGSKHVGKFGQLMVLPPFVSGEIKKSEVNRFGKSFELECGILIYFLIIHSNFDSMFYQYELIHKFLIWINWKRSVLKSTLDIRLTFCAVLLINDRFISF